MRAKRRLEFPRFGGHQHPSTKAGELHYAFFVDGRSILCEAA
jgi:hypothetical protein